MRTNVESGIAKIDVCVNVNFIAATKFPCANLSADGSGRQRCMGVPPGRMAKQESRADGPRGSFRSKLVPKDGNVKSAGGAGRCGTLGQHLAHGRHRATQLVDGVVDQCALLLQAGKLLLRLVESQP